MVSKSENPVIRPVWLVGASFGPTADQTPGFLREGRWENGYFDRYIEDVKSVLPGDRIAIKASYVRWQNLPFDNRGHPVSVMGIKATGTVTENAGDGRNLKVDWTPVDPPREWFFYTYRGTVWRVLPGRWATDGLISFVFEGEEQDIDAFRNDDYWKDRFGDQQESDPRFAWTDFYSEFADRLLAYRNDRRPLVAAIQEISSTLPRPIPLQDHFPDGTSGPMEDICPFTTFGLFNRGITDENRRRIAGRLAEFLGVKEPVPDSFEGIPTLNNLNAWFFPYANSRTGDHMDSLWRVFADALQYADVGSDADRARFAESFDDAISRHAVGPRLATGLYWIRPWVFLTLDGRTVGYLKNRLGIDVQGGRPDAETYLALHDQVESRFIEESLPLRSFPELSAAAYAPSDGAAELVESPIDDDPVDQNWPPEPEPDPEPEIPYSLDDIISEGCFLERPRLETILDRLRSKKNLILQGPPGTGKTWLAKKLAFALIGVRSERRVRPFQFHPNLSYEDFVRGWRPGGDGRLALVDGPFLTAMEDAGREPALNFVVVIEEINRGNPAQIFGEMLTLLEADKRNRQEALALSYPREPTERVHIPPNLFVIGTMNVADRSLALVDLALRRRFAFIDLEPVFGDVWRNWVSERCGLDTTFLGDIEGRLTSLNQTIAGDNLLGHQFRIGHSVVTPVGGAAIDDPVEWFRQVVETEIAPLLDEYWFDQPGRAGEEKDKLLRGLAS